MDRTSLSSTRISRGLGGIMRIGSLVRHKPDFYGMGIIMKPRSFGGWWVMFPKSKMKLFGLSDGSLEVVCE